MAHDSTALEARLPTASAFKGYLLAALYAADAAARLSLDARVEYAADDAVQGSGVLKLRAPGLRPTLRDHARLMINPFNHLIADLSRLVFEAWGR